MFKILGVKALYVHDNGRKVLCFRVAEHREVDITSIIVYAIKRSDHKDGRENEQNSAGFDGADSGQAGSAQAWPGYP